MTARLVKVEAWALVKEDSEGLGDTIFHTMQGDEYVFAAVQAHEKVVSFKDAPLDVVKNIKEYNPGVYRRLAKEEGLPDPECEHPEDNERTETHTFCGLCGACQG